MTTRNDIAVEYNSSPRIAEIAQPSAEIVMQDVVDTLRKHEDSFQGMGFKKLLNASGKEDLGGGVQVGITVALQNTKIAFAGRTTPAQTGTVTGSPASPIIGRQIIQDTAATFITNNVNRGSLVVNFTDNSIADVISVDSETQLTTRTLVNGIGNTFDNLDVYHVFNITQVSATGGNLTAVDGSQATIPSVLPTAFTQVLITASSSATTQNQLSLNHSTFEGHVTIDVINGSPGTAFPVGTGLAPSNNLTDAKLIGIANGLTEFLVLGDITIGATEVIDDLIFTGRNPSQTLITFAFGCSTKKSQFKYAELTGELAGALEIEDCHIEGLQGVGGALSETNIKNSILETAGITFSTINTQHVHIIDCRTGPPDNTFVPINFNGVGGNLTIAGFNGQIELQNMTNNQNVKLFVNSGRIRIAASCTSGTIHVHGDAEVIDNSGVGVTVIDKTISTMIDILEQIALNKKYTDPTTGLVTIFKKDDITALFSGIAYEDLAGTQTYRGQGADRQDRLT